MRAALAACGIVLAAAPACAQTGYVAPRASDGHADLGRVWSNADEEVTISQTVDGVVQTQPFTNPTDDKLPLRDPDATLAWRRTYGIYMSGKPMPEFTFGVDTLPLRDRCLMAANAAAPPMTSQGYNDAYAFVQTPGFVMIAVEMMGETRIVRMVGGAEEAKAEHGPRLLQRWTGDSVGWWENDTLVVETVNVNAQQAGQSPMPTSPDAKVVERFTRTDENVLAYSAEVTDPALYVRPFTISYSFHRTRRMWEYACHEGNYGMPGILTGVRATERSEQ